MILRRAGALLDRARAELHRSFTEEHTSRETAGSFSLGVFITMLPTLGVGLIAFFVLAWTVSRINRVAMFASVIVFNPVVKWGVYGTSFALGTAILGPVPGVSPSAVSLTAGPAIIIRLLVGNLILAVVAAAVSYVVAHRIILAYDNGGVTVVDTIVDVVAADGEGSNESDGSDRTESADGSTTADGSKSVDDSTTADGSKRVDSPE